MQFSLTSGVTRKDVHAYAKENEDHIKRRVLERAKEWAQRKIPEEAFTKFDAYDDEHDRDKFDNFQQKLIAWDWNKEQLEEFDDAFFYEALYECSKVAKRV